METFRLSRGFCAALLLGTVVVCSNALKATSMSPAKIRYVYIMYDMYSSMYL